MFATTPLYPGDPILSLNEDFHRDPRADKVNLSIGIYFDEDGRLPVMKAVQDGEASLGGAQGEGPRPYLPMAGIAEYRQVVQKLVFGADSPALAKRRVATVQTLGGSGALKVGSDFLRRLFPLAQVWISDPSWENHRVVFEGSGFTVNTYPYYDPNTGGLLFEEMKDAVSKLPRGSIVLLHACCHNPTGVDLSESQWRALVPVLSERSLIPFVDMAYQGFGAGLEADAFAVRHLVEEGLPCVVANSFSKNFSLYGERCGGLSIVCEDEQQAQRVLGQLCGTIRANYSNPPTHGAKAVAKILTTPHLAQAWSSELSMMRLRIAEMRSALHSLLEGRVDESMRQRYVQQRGMFTYTGLSPEHVDRLRSAHGVYLLRSGRLCVAGLNRSNVGVVGDAIARVLADGGR